MSQLIYCRFNSKNSLRCTISTISPCCLHIRINNIKCKTISFCVSVKANWFVSAQSHCSRTVFTISPRIRQRIDINCSNDTIFICTCTHGNFHFMAWWGADHRFIPGKDHLGRTTGLPCNNCRINFTDGSLFCSKSSTNSWFDNTHFGGRNIQCSSNNSSYVERNLRRRKYDQSSKMIHITGCTEGFHHSLLVRSGMISMFYCVFAFAEHLVHISMLFQCSCTQISLMVSTKRNL